MSKRTYSKIFYLNEPSNWKPETELEKYISERMQEGIKRDFNRFMDKFAIKGDGINYDLLFEPEF